MSHVDAEAQMQVLILEASTVLTETCFVTVLAASKPATETRLTSNIYTLLPLPPEGWEERYVPRSW